MVVKFLWFLSLAFVSFTGQVIYHLPKNPLLHFLNLQQVIFPSAFSMEPLDQRKAFFTDGSSNGKAVIVSESDTMTFNTSFTSAQKTELYAVTQVFFLFFLDSFIPILNVCIDSSLFLRQLGLTQTQQQLIPYLKITIVASMLNSLLCRIYSGSY